MHIPSSTSRASFMVKLKELLGDSYADFELLDSVEKTSYVLASIPGLLPLPAIYLMTFDHTRRKKEEGLDNFIMRAMCDVGYMIVTHVNVTLS